MILSQIHLDLDLLPGKKGVYFVGGTTRDLLLGRTPLDYDITVSQNPEIFAEMTASRSHGRLIRMGRPGKQSYRVVAGRTVLDITGINGPTIRHDLERRDVTINALAIEVDSGAILDWVEGRRDLLEKRIRMISEHNFQDDPIRLLRVFRLAAVLDFSIEEETFAAVSEHAHRIRSSAGERIRTELHQLLHSRHSAPYVAMMAESGLLSAIMAGQKPVQKIQGDAMSSLRFCTIPAYTHLENLLNHPPPEFPGNTSDWGLPAFQDRVAWQKLAMLLTPCPEGPSGNDEAVDRAESVCQRLRLSTKEKTFVTCMVRNHAHLHHLHDLFRQKSLSPRAVAKFFMAVESLTPHLLLHLLATTRSASAHPDRNPASLPDFVRHMLHAYRKTYRPRKSLPPFVTGRDLQMLFGIAPSPLFKQVLTRIDEGRLSGEIADRETALTFAAEMIQKFKNQGNHM